MTEAQKLNWKMDVKPWIKTQEQEHKALKCSEAVLRKLL
jgi:hypothetical protein